MIKTKLLLLIPILAGLGWYAAAAAKKDDAPPPSAAAPAPAVDWLSDFTAAQDRAKAEHKLLLLDFTGSDWCPPCMMLDRTVFSQPEYSRYAAEHLVSLKIDFPRFKKLSDAQQAANHDLARRFGIRGYPTIIVLSPAGQPLGQLGYMPGGTRVFIGELEKLRAASK